MEMNGWYACKGFDRPSGGGVEGAKDPKACLPLHLSERVEHAFPQHAFKIPESGSIGCEGDHAGPVEQALVYGFQSAD